MRITRTKSVVEEVEFPLYFKENKYGAIPYYYHLNEKLGVYVSVNSNSIHSLSISYMSAKIEDVIEITKDEFMQAFYAAIEESKKNIDE